MNLIIGSYFINDISLAIHQAGQPSAMVFFIWGAGAGLILGMALFYILSTTRFRKRFFSKFSSLKEADGGLLEQMNESLLIDNIELQSKQDKLELENQILSSFSEELNAKKKRIEEQQKEIESSIDYASIIQTALFPSEPLLEEIFSDFFIFFQPRDTVSGDFYFARKHKEKTVLIIADCTGHGVPGAFLSVLGFSLLEQIIPGVETDSAGVLMNRLRRIFKVTLGQNRLEKTNRDSIDMGLVIIDKPQNQINFSGANNDLFFVRANGGTEVCKGDRMPVGVHENDFVPFRDYFIHYSKNDSMYMFSDGYPDQFGGPKGKKYGRARFKEFLTYISDLPMEQQKQALRSNLNEWRFHKDNDAFQVDDILVAGVRF